VIIFIFIILVAHSEKQTIRMKKLNLLSTILLGFIILSCSSDNDNDTVDLSQFQDYTLEFFVDIQGSNQTEPYEYLVTVFSTNSDNQIIETTESVAGEIEPNSTLSIADIEIVKEYKLVGVSVTGISGNLHILSARLSRVSDSNEVLNATINIPSTATITYDFETGTETVTSE
jgi:hypothetical protein